MVNPGGNDNNSNDSGSSSSINCRGLLGAGHLHVRAAPLLGGGGARAPAVERWRARLAKR
eukprot:12132277-Heterocapsa_arctica.AAC.1